MSEVALMAKFTPSAHWYHEDGRPCYEIPMSTKSGLRKPNILDARRLGLLPSVTTIEGIIEKPQLANWKMRQLLHAAKQTDIDKIIDETAKIVKKFQFKTEDEWHNEIARVAEEKWYDVSIERYENATSEKRLLGSAVHTAIASWLQGVDPVYPEDQKPFAVKTIPFINTFMSWYRQNMMVKQEPEIEGTIPTTLGYGGRFDYLGRDKKKVLTLLDYKTTGIKDSNKNFKPYPSWPTQGAAYATALIRGRQIVEKVRVVNVVISNINPKRVLDFD